MRATPGLTLTEGRYHQARRMFAAIGNHVEALHRSRVAAWSWTICLSVNGGCSIPGRSRGCSPKTTESDHDSE